MLAVQRPSMGSSKPPNLDMPFGYNFDTTSSNFPYPSPTAPPNGPSLLDIKETQYLDSFFDEVNSTTFNYDLFTNPPDGSELGLDWNELPPTFMGTQTSFGQQPVIGNHGLPESSFTAMHSHSPMTAGPSMPPTTSADVLAAATLLQNGSASRSHSMGGELFGSHGMSMQPTNGNMRSHSVSQYPPPRPTHGLPQRATGENFFRDDFYREMVFGSEPHPTIQRRIAAQKVDIQWGSDAGFGSPQGFNNSDHDKVVERAQLQALEAGFTIDSSNINSSADNTRPSSPNHHRTKSMNRSGEDDDSRPRKRRKSKFTDDDDEDSKYSGTPKNSRRRKSTKRGADDSPDAEGSEQNSKRRKSAAASAAAAAKASRENLTEDQKRENHIKSEQKRRTLIREGFEDLGELVPGLKGGGFSKSAVLIMAADWLEELMQGNQELQGRLNHLEGR